MIYSDAFVWMHFPKTAGTTVERIFDAHFTQDRGIHRDQRPMLARRLLGQRLLSRLGLIQAFWHDSLEDRQRRQPGFRWEGKTVICGFRSLPQWLYSRHTFSMQRAPSLPHRAENLLDGRFYEETGVLNHADNYPLQFLPRDVIESGMLRVIRTEHFREDFLDAFRDMIPVERIPPQDFSVVHNRTQARDDRAWDLIQSNLERIYSACPYWAELEAMFYPLQPNTPPST